VSVCVVYACNVRVACGCVVCACVVCVCVVCMCACCMCVLYVCVCVRVCCMCVCACVVCACVVCTCVVCACVVVHVFDAGDITLSYHRIQRPPARSLFSLVTSPFQTVVTAPFRLLAHAVNGTMSSSPALVPAAKNETIAAAEQPISHSNAETKQQKIAVVRTLLF
jgi:hypothetical protein